MEKISIKKGVCSVLGIIAIIILFIVARSYISADRCELTNSIAVLPFENVSGDSQIDYLSTGIPEVIINKLSRLSNFKKIISLQSVLPYRGQEVSPKKLGKELGVGSVLMTRMEKQGDILSINTSLIETSDESQLWGEKYERKIDDIFFIEKEIAAAVVEAVKIELDEGEEQEVTKHHTANSEAYQGYLKGRYMMLGFGKGITKAIEYFSAAVKKDPSFAYAYAGLSESYSLLAQFGIQSPDKAYPEAMANAEEALRIDDELAEAHAAMGWVKFMFEWDWEAAEEEFEHAVELSPASAHVYNNYIPYLLAMNRTDEAIAAAKRYLKLSPIELFANVILGWAYFEAGKYDESIEQLKKALELDPTYVWTHTVLSWNYVFKKMYPEALAQCEKVQEISEELDPWSLATIAYAYAVADARFEAWQILGELQERAKKAYVDPFNFAVIHAGLGEKKEVFEWLDKAYKIKSPQMVYLKISAKPGSWLESLGSDPRLENLIAKMKF